MIELCRAGGYYKPSNCYSYGVLDYELTERGTSVMLDFIFKLKTTSSYRTLNYGSNDKTYVEIDGNRYSYTTSGAVNDGTMLLAGGIAVAETYGGGIKKGSFVVNISINIGGDVYTASAEVERTMKDPDEQVDYTVPVTDEELIRIGGSDDTYKCTNYAILKYTETISGNESVIDWTYDFSINPTGYKRTLNYGNTNKTFVEIDGDKTSFTTASAQKGNGDNILNGTKRINRSDKDTVLVTASVNIGGDIFTETTELKLSKGAGASKYVYIGADSAVKRGTVYVGVENAVKMASDIYIGVDGGVKRGV